MTCRDLEHLKFPLIRYSAIACLSLPILVSIWQAALGYDYSSEDCEFQALLGFPSPSCGLTRSFIALVSGNFLLSIQYHIFGPFFFVLFVSLIGFFLL